MAHGTVTSVAAAVPRAAAASSPSQFLTGFVLGGLFFSTLLLILGTFFVLGAENVRRVLDVRSLVFGRVWNTFCQGLGAAKLTLQPYGKGPWNWRGAWTVFKQNLVETRAAVAAALEAIRLESQLYAATVGKPGLIALQYSVDKLTPKFLATMIEDNLRRSLETIRDKNVRRVELVEFDLGRKSPELLDARAYELGDDAMAFDVDVRWESEITARMVVTTNALSTPLIKIPISVHKPRFVGVVRVVLSPLTADPPGFGAALVSLPTAPTLGLDVRMAGGEISRLPWLRKEIMSVVQRGIEDEYLWPRRVVIPSPAKPEVEPETMLSSLELEVLGSTDPLLRAERKLAETPAYRPVSNLERPAVRRGTTGIGVGSSVVASDRNGVRTVTEKSPLRMDILLKDENCDEDEDTECLIDDGWFDEIDEAEAAAAEGGGQRRPLERIWRPVVEFSRNKGTTTAINDGKDVEGDAPRRRRRDSFRESIENIKLPPLENLWRPLNETFVRIKSSTTDKSLFPSGQRTNRTGIGDGEGGGVGAQLERVWNPTVEFVRGTWQEGVDRVTRIVPSGDKGEHSGGQADAAGENSEGNSIDDDDDDDDDNKKEEEEEEEEGAKREGQEEEQKGQELLVHAVDTSLASSSEENGQIIDEANLPLELESGWTRAFDTVRRRSPITRWKNKARIRRGLSSETSR